MNMARDEIKATEDPYLKSLEELQRLRRFEGEPQQFWASYLRVLVALSEAANGLVAVRERGREGAWRIVALAPPSLKAGQHVEVVVKRLAEESERCLREGVSRWEQDGNRLLAVRLDTGSDQDQCLAVFLLENGRSLPGREILRRLELASDAPASYQLRRVALESRTKVEHFASVLDLMVLINAEKRFLAAAMVFCNELASRHRCERVSIGWLEGGYIRLQAISHVDHFESKTDAVQMLERVMEECLDQNAEIVMPATLGGGAVTRDHRAFAQSQGAASVCSMPLRVEDQPVAVCTCERSSSAFNELDLRLMRLECDQSARRLADLKRLDRWFGARLAAWLRERLGRLIGFENTWLKVIGILVAVLLGFLVFAKVPFRIKAPASLRTEDLTYLTAPFSGHIDRVRARVGDAVNEGQELLVLDQSNLLLQEGQLIAEQNRYLSEFEKARASGAPADMRITRALYEQAAARHELVRHQLAQSILRAPFAGIVVEGDPIEHIGSPVQQGDVLFKLARIDRLFVELEVSELDVHELAADLQGEFALASRPQEKYRIRVFRMEPMAVPKEKGNVFIVHASFPDGIREWWRPGMTGVAKLDIGMRNLVWVLSHRTVDFLRLKLWW
jgi:multidrug efflux pump subunit AcrA (membrane-fusion protein)